MSKLSDELLGKARLAINDAEAYGLTPNFNRDFVRDLIDEVREARLANADLGRRLDATSRLLDEVTAERDQLSHDFHRVAGERKRGDL